MSNDANNVLIDRFQRRVEYVRFSVTDRCDFRCVYCMAEEMTFVPKSDVLTLEEIREVVRAFVELGVGKIRLTGGEPLIRNNVLSLVASLGKLDGLDGVRNEGSRAWPAAAFAIPRIFRQQHPIAKGRQRIHIVAAVNGCAGVAMKDNDRPLW